MEWSTENRMRLGGGFKWVINFPWSFRQCGGLEETSGVHLTEVIKKFAVVFMTASNATDFF